MSAASGFSSPNVEAQDYYERLGAPADASAEDINNHTKKYVAEFKPELSDHENADERWNRFNEARQTLNDADNKEEYDTFRDRFGPEDGAEAYEAWEARDRPGDPATLDPARDLNRPSIGDEGDSQTRRDATSSQDQRQGRDRDQQRRQQRQRQASQEERRRRARERERRRREADIDLDSSKAYSTRAERQADATDDSGETGSETSTVREVLSHLRTSGRVATSEFATILSMLELLVIGYLVYAISVQVAAAGVADAVGLTVVQDVVTVGVVLGLGFLLVRRYLDKFTAGPAGSGATGSLGRTLITESDRPTWFVFGTAIVAVLFGGLLALGGGATTLLFLGLALLFTYGRYRVFAEVTETPDWDEYVEPAGAVGAALLFATVFTFATPGTSVGGALQEAGAAALGGVFLLILVIAGLPAAATQLSPTTTSE